MAEPKIGWRTPCNATLKLREMERERQWRTLKKKLRAAIAAIIRPHLAEQTQRGAVQQSTATVAGSGAATEPPSAQPHSAPADGPDAEQLATRLDEIAAYGPAHREAVPISPDHSQAHSVLSHWAVQSDEPARPRPAPTLKTWLSHLARKGGKGTVDNVDARSLGRVADALESQAAEIASLRAELHTALSREAETQRRHDAKMAEAEARCDKLREVLTDAHTALSIMERSRVWNDAQQECLARIEGTLAATEKPNG